MSSLDLVIVTLFLLTVVYIVNRAIASLDKQTKVDFVSKLDTSNPRIKAPDPQIIDPASKDFKPREEPFDQQLERMTFGDRSLKDILGISFKFKKRYKYDLDDHDKDEQPRFLIMNVENKSKDIDIYINWDSCSLTDYDNTARRVVRLTTDKDPILADSQPPKFQPPSLVAPGDKLTATFTAEDTLKPNTEKQIMEPKVPILDFKAIKAKSKNKDVPKAVREELEKRLTSFDDRKRTFDFFLRLSLKLVTLNTLETGADTSDRPYYLWCKFTVLKMPWYDQLPWNPKK
ncbi:hypothetical protein [Thermocoleostomius sinensis]|jgi:hypothetical protein|uniref:Uncharacterized protein n=1 Tax=Thermocoleostomius sinensis A174 TaxID=2016057 RepID=A0A9E8ZCW6_9CYAN|nr:hypothetical protein [Thermocoleostomius sinensis]WAL59579.1 hypothetical protein OXH18_20780 [Thermocoleostomius sinensis A174]